MTIEEIKQERKITENKICQILLELQKETGFIPTYIAVSQDPLSVKITLELP